MAASPSASGKLRIWFNLSWGMMRTESRCFAPQQGPVIAGMDEAAKLPLFGFRLEAESYPIAEWAGAIARLYPPPDASVEVAAKGEPFGPAQLHSQGGRDYVELTAGARARLREGDQLMMVTVDELSYRAGWDKQKAAFWMAFLILTVAGPPLAFLLAGPDPELASRAMEGARLKQGKTAAPPPMIIEEAEELEGGPHRPAGTIVLPASVR